MEYLLISGCLIGNNTKYNGLNNYTPLVEKLKEKYELIICCPEVDGGLSIPRNPSEISGNIVISNMGVDVTNEFNLGAQKALELVKKYRIKKALLKEGSPSCGTNYIYDGTFTGTKINGLGVTAKLLKENGVLLFNEKEIEKLL
ncbi:MAG: DUF523 domain-containing protein [Acholeplasmatales bacterium]|nr:DUF523 domain-containing protein [Acholeplasmatales bacterium]